MKDFKIMGIPVSALIDPLIMVLLGTQITFKGVTMMVFPEEMIAQMEDFHWAFYLGIGIWMITASFRFGVSNGTVLDLNRELECKNCCESEKP